ncbi:MAG: hypothetical protein JSR63_03125 [Proteobacteria bacterium]|nr:hypothetical protein [Pseudomonadota bacterium]
MIKLAFLVLFALSQTAYAQSSGPEIPDDLMPNVRSAEIDGAAIYRYDHAAAVATDAALTLKEFQKDRRIAGWLTEDEGRSTIVTFYGNEASPGALYQVTVSDSGSVVGSPRTLEPAVPLTSTQSAQVSARSVASKSGFAPCSKSYNPVVLARSSNGVNTWSVYMLAGTTTTGVLPAGGNYRIDTDETGKNIISTRGFTKSCIELTMDRRADALMLTHLMDPTPTEIHVFLNLLAGKPMYLITTKNSFIWSIENGKIKFIQKAQPKG